MLGIARYVILSLSKECWTFMLLCLLNSFVAEIDSCHFIQIY